jgi:hypothetical protein
MSVMRRFLFALLVFLPTSTAPAHTPPPQGWEERNELRALLPQVLEVLQDHRKTLDGIRLSVARLEVENVRVPGLDERIISSMEERRISSMSQKRRSICAMEGRVRQLEEEVARIKRMLGIKP